MYINHGVSTGECEETLFNILLVMKDDPNHSRTEPRFLVLGQTMAGRYLLLSFIVRLDKIRIISARDMNRKVKNIYEKSNPLIQERRGRACLLSHPRLQ
jgi:uncharacterized DUF497 family protein